MNETGTVTSNVLDQLDSKEFERFNAEVSPVLTRFSTDLEQI